MRLLEALGYDACGYSTTLSALEDERPTIYLKGPDWQACGIPADEAAYCASAGIAVQYAPPSCRRGSSTAHLQAWAQTTAVRGVAALDHAAAHQRVVPFDAAAQGYLDREARRAIEADHPRILAGLCGTASVLDVGCGPGHLVAFMRELGVSAHGVDPVAPQTTMTTPLPVRHVASRSADVVVCREVLEHVPVHHVGPFLADLFRIARERVYLTTRFTADPAHPYDLTTETAVDPSHITLLPQPFVRALCVTMGGQSDPVWEAALDWQRRGRVLVYEVTR